MWLSWLFAAGLLALPAGAATSTRVPMGVKDPNCDPARDDNRVDWDWNPKDYTCREDEDMLVEQKEPGIWRTGYKIDYPCHVCYPDAIRYNVSIPTSGCHRPNWAKWGEYRFLPIQRWLHNLEHGAAVFLYHPCLKKDVVQKFTDIARDCLYRHIITPSRNLPLDKPMAVITWGWKLELSHVRADIVKQHLRKFAIHRAPEAEVWKDGFYDTELLHHAQNVTTPGDKVICPELSERLGYKDGVALHGFRN